MTRGVALLVAYRINNRYLSLADGQSGTRYRTFPGEPVEHGWIGKSRHGPTVRCHVWMAEVFCSGTFRFLCLHASEPCALFASPAPDTEAGPGVNANGHPCRIRAGPLDLLPVKSAEAAAGPGAAEGPGHRPARAAVASSACPECRSCSRPSLPWGVPTPYDPVSRQGGIIANNGLLYH